MKTLSFQIPDNLEASLKAVAKKRGIDSKSLVKEAVEAYLAKVNSSNGRSCFELSADLAGSLDGPSDIATNRIHMEGYGT